MHFVCFAGDSNFSIFQSFKEISDILLVCQLANLKLSVVRPYRYTMLFGVLKSSKDVQPPRTAELPVHADKNNVEDANDSTDSKIPPTEAKAKDHIESIRARKALLLQTDDGVKDVDAALTV